MKKIIIMFAIALLAPRLLQSQGITYLSNLGQTSTGSNPVGGDSWVASTFATGNNAGGYLLDSIQLAMMDASGNPSGFTAMIYNAGYGFGDNLGSNLATLTGSANPSTVGIYAYTPASSLTLSPNSEYYIVLTAGTATADGAYDWSLTSPISYSPSGGWGGAGGVWKSSDGSTWLYNSGAPQFAITATGVPEPGILGLIGLGGLLLLRHRRKI